MASHKLLPFFALAIALLLSSTAFTAFALSITVATDKASYNPGQTVVISGQATAGAAVTVQVVNPLGTTIFMDVATASSAGVFTTSFRLPQDAATGTYKVYASAAGESASTSFTVAQAPPTPPAPALNVALDASPIYFRGEKAEVYILVSCNGEPVEANISSSVYSLQGVSVNVAGQRIAKGLYVTSFTIPSDSPTGTYVVVVNASATVEGAKVKGAAMKSILVSSTLTEWNAKLISINGTVATIGTSLGVIRVKLDNNTAAIIAQLKTVKSDLLSQLNSISDKVSTLSNSVDSVKSTLTAGVQNIRNDIAGVKGDLATLSDSMSKGFSSVNSAVGTLSSSVNSLGNSLSGQITSLGNSLSGQITSLGNTLSKSISDNANSIQTSIKNAQDSVSSQVKSSVGDLSTFLIIIGILAAITLVIEAAILIRRLS